jgi:hypothetical protein
MPFEDYLIEEGEDIIEVEYCMSELVDKALGQRRESPSFDLNAKPLDSLDIDERPPPIVKLATAQHHAHLLIAFFMDNPLKFTLANIMKQQAISEKLNKLYVANLK